MASIARVRFCQLWLLILSFLAFFSASPALGRDWVEARGTQLFSGGQPFYFVGANNYYLFYKSQAMVDEVLEDAARMGMSVMRTWAFCDGQWAEGQSLQPEARRYNEESFRKLDYIVYRASQLGLRLVFSLVNNWDNFGGMNAYVRWSPTAKTHDDFYSDEETRSIFRDYISYLLYRTNFYTGIRYKDDPTIMMWELANEPRVEYWRRGDLYRWIDEMAAHIKSIDGKHLVSTGSEGAIATDFVATHRSPSIDVASFHLYPDHWGFDEVGTLSYIRQQVDAAHYTLGKPVFAGEFGQQGSKDRAFQTWFREFSERNIAGALVWILSGRQEDGSLYPDYDGYSLYYPESTETIPALETFARQYQAPRQVSH